MEENSLPEPLTREQLVVAWSIYGIVWTVLGVLVVGCLFCSIYSFYGNSLFHDCYHVGFEQVMPKYCLGADYNLWQRVAPGGAIVSAFLGGWVGLWFVSYGWRPPRN